MTFNLRYLLIVCVMLITLQTSKAQFGFSHEVGVIAGPVQFRSDFGQRLNEENKIKMKTIKRQSKLSDLCAKSLS